VSETTNIVIDYTPRDWQRELHDHLKRFNVIVCHRGGGKSIFCMNELIRRAMTGKPYGEYAYVLPFKIQAQRNVWEPLKRFLAPIPNLYLNNNRLEAVLPNGAKLMVLGADDPDRLRGIHLSGLVLDEFADMAESLWGVVVPMLTNHSAWVIFIGTPRGKNSFYQKYMESQLPENKDSWLGVYLPYTATNCLKDSEIEMARRTMSADFFAQEMECFPTGSMVAIADGIVPIEQIKTGDLVLTHTGHLRKVTATMSRPFVGDLTVIKSYGSRPLRMTPEHPVQICNPERQTYDWRPAKDIQPRDWLVTPKKTKGLPLISAPLAELIAWFITEGNVSQNTVNISLGSHETTFIQRVIDCFTALGRISRAVECGPVTRIYCCDVALGDFLISTCGSGAHNKRIPLSLITGHEWLVFNTLIDGDGNIVKRKNRTSYMYTSVSECLIQQLQLLAAILDLAGTYTVTPAHQCVIEGRNVFATESYQLQVYKTVYYDVKNKCSKVRTAKNGVLGKIHSIDHEHYDGLVYNLSVAEDNSYVVNTRAVHNCSWEASSSGSYYTRQVSEVRAKGNIVYDSSLYRSDLEVHTSFDIGHYDATACWWFQTVRNHETGEDVLHFIDYEEAPNLALADWNQILLNREKTLGYRRGTLIFPHDIKVYEWGAGISRIESAEQLGMIVDECPKQELEDGIELVRRHLISCKFDGRRCGDGIEALTQYREKRNKQGIGMGIPLHDSSSNGADSFRYAITYVKQVMSAPKLLRKPFLRRR
jgi:hypothetical protein